MSLSETASHEESMETGRGLVRDINAWWARTLKTEVNRQSFLELEFETCFERFYLPTMRGSDTGTKKRYVGWERVNGGHKLTVKGVEAARSDATAWIKRVQMTIFRRIFEGMTSLEAYGLIESEIAALRAGTLDEELVINRRLRRSRSEYESHLPPHARAAIMLDQPGRSVAYVWTHAGPQPVSVRTSPIDYAIYIERHLGPALDGVLKHLDLRVRDIADRQIKLF